ncbi:MucBP domain-containing protein, partial [Enterococcus mundtii]|uniref:MucBP domain-containing protein n=1 Tax=Enterococcus mundtii TaxID=53346 RepID=UPI00163D96A0
MKGSKLNNLLLVTILIGQLSYGSPTDAFADNVGIESNSLNKKDIANMSIQTNADQVKQGDRLDLTFRIVNSSEQLIPMGKSFIIHVDSKGIDYGTIDLSDTILNRYFNSTVNAADGTITLILKKDIIGDGSHINAKIGSTVTGEIGNSYKITANDNNGNTIPVDHDTFSPGDNLSVYGTINSYWGHSDIDNGNFTGKDSIIEAGVFSRSTNRIDIFGEFNTNYQNWGDLVDNTKGKYVNMVFSYDSNQKLDISSIKLYKRSDHSNVDFTTIDDGSSVKPIVIIDELNHTFIVKLRFNSVMGGPSSKEVLGVDYSTYVKDATISYQNNMKLLDQDGNVLPPEFNLYSIFTEEGSSLVFPTVLSENQRFPLGELNSTNAEQILKEKTSAKDTDDGDISLENITVDTSKINFDRPGIYKVTYKAINSAGMIAGKTYDVEIYDNAIAALPLIVHYVDETGKEIHEAQKISGNIGDKYDATTDEYKLKIEGYSLDEDKLPINSVGTLSDTDQTVTYVYKQDPIKANDVTVHYVDETGKEIHEVEKISGNIGDKYDATTDEYKLKIEGYSLDEDKLPINSVGTLSDTDQTVTYVYKQDPIKA